MTQHHLALRALAVRQGQDLRAWRCGGFFPLTPALSLGERVNPALRGEQSRPVGFPLRDARCSLPMNRTRKLLEMNECSKTGSWAQGAIKVRGDLSLRERVRVRGNGAAYPPL